MCSFLVYSSLQIHTWRHVTHFVKTHRIWLHVSVTRNTELLVRPRKLAILLKALFLRPTFGEKRIFIILGDTDGLPVSIVVVRYCQT